MKDLVMRGATRLSYQQVNQNFADVKSAVDAAEALIASLTSSVQGLTNLVGTGTGDADAVINAVAEVYTFLQGFPEGTGALLTQLNRIRQDIVALQNAGSGGGGGSDLTKLGIEVDDRYLREVDKYAADGTTLVGTMLSLNMDEIINEVREAITGMTTPSPNGVRMENSAGPLGNTLEFLRLQTYVASAPFTASDLEYAYGSNLTTIIGYEGPLAYGTEARPLGYLNGRIRGNATRNPSPWVKSLAVAAAIATPVNYLPHSADIMACVNFGEGALDAYTMAPDGTMTAVSGRNYNSGTLNFNRAPGLINGNSYNFSIFIKPADVTVLTGGQLFTNDNANISVFKFAELQATELTPTIKSVSINELSSLGGNWVGWYQVAMSFQLEGNAMDIKMRLFGTYSEVKIWAPQINDGLVRTTTLLAA